MSIIHLLSLKLYKKLMVAEEPKKHRKYTAGKEHKSTIKHRKT